MEVTRTPWRMSVLTALACYTLSTAALIEQTWTVDYKFVAPDGVEKLVPAINGQVPGVFPSHSAFDLPDDEDERCVLCS